MRPTIQIFVNSSSVVDNDRVSLPFKPEKNSVSQRRILKFSVSAKNS